MPKYKPVTHIIFAMDGLLLNTEPITQQIYDELVATYRKTVPIELTWRLHGRDERDLVNMLINELHLPVRFPTLKDRLNKLEDEKFKRIKMMLGGERLICHFKRHNIPMAVATSSRKELVDMKFAGYLGLYQNIHHVVSASDEEVPRSKPEPTIFKVCAARFDENPDPENCLVIESSAAGVSAACCAGMQVVAVPDPLVDRELLRDATLIINSLVDFKPQLFGLPPIPQ